MSSTDENDGSATSGGGLAMIQRLRNESFNQDTERRLNLHPYIKAAEKGTLTIAQRRAFAQEQYAVQLSDATSFATLAGHSGFVPSSLSTCNVPEPVRSPPEGTGSDLFQFLLGGEVYASKLLLTYAEKVGLDETSLSSYKASALAQAYPSYWARLALSGKRAAGAAACAVNFPAWGRMCQRLCDALGKAESGYGYDGTEDGGLAFVAFFASPIENLDEMASAIIEEEGAAYEDLVEAVRLLQDYEVLFWDAVFAATYRPSADEAD